MGAPEAGRTLALLWGNAAFERPPVPFESFLTGIGLHDRAYGPLDNLPIGGIAEEEWLALTRSGFEMTWADPIADLITKMHLKRLASYGSAPPRQALTAEMAQTIQAQIQRHGLDAATFERIDRITDLCDRIACLILDDIGYVQHDRDEMEALFTLLAERYERRSVIITTNLVFSEWNRIFKDPMTTMAAIDRVVHHSVILDMIGLESYRAKQAHAAQNVSAPTSSQATAGSVEQAKQS